MAGKGLGAAGPDPAVDNLSKFDHLVVLMMENRSFDHLLGYLSLPLPDGAGRTDIDGLRPGMDNRIPGDPQPYPIRLLTNTAQIEKDPCHYAECVDRQMAQANGGFAEDYRKAGGDPALIMGYYNASGVPVFDLLAREFVVCDRWFSPVPGPTWPNRLYAVAGRAPNRKNRMPPLYYEPSFVRHLDRAGVTWRWYAHEKIALGPLTTIALIDGDYPSVASSFFVDPHFFVHAREGKLAAVSWIDPNFYDYGGLEGANDDHPPADLKAGQGLVQSVVQALSRSPQWEKTLLIITYDEHGGFYDHVAPPEAAGKSPFNRYGVRVPAIVVSPWVRAGVADHTLYDHTSIIKSILLRFCRDAAGGIPDMGARVAAARHLGPLLDSPVPRPPLPNSAFAPAIATVSSWLTEAHTARVNLATSPIQPDLTEFEQGWKRAAGRIERKRRAELLGEPRRGRRKRKRAGRSRRTSAGR